MVFYPLLVKLFYFWVCKTTNKQHNAKYLYNLAD